MSRRSVCGKPFQTITFMEGSSYCWPPVWFSDTYWATSSLVFLFCTLYLVLTFTSPSFMLVRFMQEQFCRAPNFLRAFLNLKGVCLFATFGYKLAQWGFFYSVSAGTGLKTKDFVVVRKVQTNAVHHQRLLVKQMWWRWKFYFLSVHFINR